MPKIEQAIFNLIMKEAIELARIPLSEPMKVAEQAVNKYCANEDEDTKADLVFSVVYNLAGLTR